MKRVLGAIAVVAIGMVVLEIVMEPTSADRREVFLLFVGMASVTLIAGYLVPKLGLQARSLSHTVAAVGLVAAALIALAVAAGSWRMFLSVHDLHLVTVVLGVAAGLSVVFAVSVTRSLRQDLDALRRTTDQVATGDLTRPHRRSPQRRAGLYRGGARLDDRAARRR